MKRDLVLSGMGGLISGIFILFFAYWIKGYLPSLVSNLIATVVVFVILIAIELAEMPMMVFGLRKLAQSASTPRAMISGGFMLYVMFAAVYAAIFVLLTGDHYLSLGTVLAALGLARLATGILVR